MRFDENNPEHLDLILRKEANVINGELVFTKDPKLTSSQQAKQKVLKGDEIKDVGVNLRAGVFDDESKLLEYLSKVTGEKSLCEKVNQLLEEMLQRTIL